MEFGRVPEKELSRIDFTLPADPADNTKVLKGTKHTKPLVYFGGTRWACNSWVGSIYPKGAKDATFLDHYVQFFNSIELNATHYQVYGPAVISKWAARAIGKDFKFCPKVPQIISHYSNFNNVFDLTSSFLEGVLAFGENLGPIFLQISEKYAPDRRGQLFRYLESLPTDLQFFVEVRHENWFADKVVYKELTEVLRARNMGMVITDTPGRRDCTHMQLTVPKTFLRLVGNDKLPVDYARIDSWVKRLQYWIDNGLEETYVFLHMLNDVTCPELTAYMEDKLLTAAQLPLRQRNPQQPGQPAKGTQISFFD
ncbi:MAG: DUF72 domain-containing protein [Chitinophagaceae bacterium]